MRWLRTALIAVAAKGLACGGDDDPEPFRGPFFLDRPEGELPATLAELGLYPNPADRSVVHERVEPYETGYPLWSNGSSKARYVLVPEGSSIDASDRKAWVFPEGTLFFKTFSYPIPNAPARERPIETRVIRLTEGRTEYAVYRWNEAGTAAELLDLMRPVPVSVGVDGEDFDHVIPARLDCRKCHESQPVNVLGFDELGLAAAVPASGGDSFQRTTELSRLATAGLVSNPPARPDVIVHEDPLTEQVLGYIEGNCTHCHNGGSQASASYDLRYPVALEELIDQETEGKALTGLRVAAGRPEDSALLLALSREEIPGIQPMPPVGVERRDEAALELFEAWILSLAPDAD